MLVEKGTGRPVLIDFGLARGAQPIVPATLAVGTQWSMAPEQGRGLEAMTSWKTSKIRMCAAKRNDRARPRSASPVRGNDTDEEAEPRSPLILVVDDVEDNRELYASYFAFAGYRTDQAGDGEEALTKIAREPPDLVIMDLSMPRVDGWEATRLLKSNPRTKNIVVLVVTGFAMKIDIERARAAGADDVLTKPCLPKVLLARVEELLGRG